MQLPPVRDSSGVESPRPRWDPCDVPHGEGSWPSLEPTGTPRQPVGAARFGNGTMSWYPRRSLAPSRGQALDHVAFEVDSLDALLDRLRRAGVKVLAEPHAFGETRAAMIEDPDGLALELIERRA
jgi:catechol 2,3-dioxygenase-like lactoylglutathione lyase family enzyme